LDSQSGASALIAAPLAIVDPRAAA
jgi:hypothetical protein